MTQLFNFFSIYENAIYFLLGLGAILYGWRFWIAWRDLRESVYGLEREIAISGLNRSGVALFMVVILGLSVFSVVTFAAPFLPVEDVITTPIIDLEGGFSSTRSAQDSTEIDQSDILAPTPLPTVSIDVQSCVEDRLIITSPEAGDTIRGTVNINGTVDVENFGFFQVEYARIQDGLWLPINVKHNVVINGLLVEDWDTSPIPAGDYVLQLLVTDNVGDEFDSCRIQVRIEAEN